MHLSNEDTVCSPNHRVLSTNPYTSKRVPWLLTIDSTVYTNGVIGSLATDPVYWLQFLHCLLGSRKTAPVKLLHLDGVRQLVQTH